MRPSLIVLALCAISAHPAVAADAVLPDYFPPDTAVVFGFSLRPLLDSSLVKSMQAEMQKVAADLMKSADLKGGTISGFDPLKDVDDLIIAATPAKDKSTALIVAHGRFGASRPPGKLDNYHGVPIFAGAVQTGPGPGQGVPGVIALLDDSTALLGEAADVRAAIDRRGMPSSLKPALAEQARAMAARFDFWGVGDLPEGYQPPSGSSDAFNSVDHFEFGAALRHGLEITGKIHTRSAPDAQKMAESMKQLQAMLKSQASASNGTKMDLESDNGTIQLTIQVSEEDLKKAVEAQKAGFAAGMAAPKPKPLTPTCKSSEVVVCLPGAR